MKYKVTYECLRFKQRWECIDIFITKGNYNSLEEELHMLAYKSSIGEIRNLTYKQI